MAAIAVAFLIFKSNKHRNAIVGVLNASSHAAHCAPLRKFAPLPSVAVLPCPCSCVARPTLSTQSIFGTSIGQDARLVVFVAIPCELLTLLEL